MSARLSDEQVAWIITIGSLVGAQLDMLAREVQDWRAFMLGEPCERGCVNGWQPNHGPGLQYGVYPDCPNPDCVKGHQAGLIEKLEAMRARYPYAASIMSVDLDFIIAEARRMVES